MSLTDDDVETLRLSADLAILRGSDLVVVSAAALRALIEDRAALTDAIYDAVAEMDEWSRDARKEAADDVWNAAIRLVRG